MRFRQVATFRGLALQPDDDPVRFLVGDQAAVTLFGVTDKEITEAAEREQDIEEDARAVAEITLDPPPDYLAAFVSIGERRLPDSSPPEKRGTRFVGKDGELLGGEIVHMDALTPDLQAFISDTRARLRRTIRIAFSAIAWRMAVTGHHDPVSFGRAFWSLDGEKWEMFPTSGIVGFATGQGIYRLHGERQEDIQTLINFGLREPLGHALWREASAQRGTNPRSAILIGVAALEVGVKQFAALRVPLANWLLKETQSPPVTKMLSRFLPDLPPLAKGKRFRRPSKAQRKIIQRAVDLRNDIAHQGVEHEQLKRTEVDEILATVRDLLWQLDVASGVKWAERYVESDDGEDEVDDQVDGADDDGEASED
jgi:hypothetical protein